MGNIINALAILVAGTMGHLFGEMIPKEMEKTVINGLGLAVLLIGLKNMLVVDDIYIIYTIISLVLGGILGEYFNIDNKFNMGALKIEKILNKYIKGNIASGMVYASLIYCVGAMAILGSIEMAISNTHSILLAKAIIDGVTAIAFASVMGIGVALSGIVVFLYQGFIYILAILLGDFATEEILTSIKGLGGILIFAIGLNMMDIKKIKVANLLPSIFIIIIIVLIRSVII